MGEISESVGKKRHGLLLSSEERGEKFEDNRGRALLPLSKPWKYADPFPNIYATYS